MYLSWKQKKLQNTTTKGSKSSFNGIFDDSKKKEKTSTYPVKITLSNTDHPANITNIESLGSGPVDALN